MMTFKFFESNELRKWRHRTTMTNRFSRVEYIRPDDDGSNGYEFVWWSDDSIAMDFNVHSYTGSISYFNRYYESLRTMQYERFMALRENDTQSNWVDWLPIYPRIVSINTITTGRGRRTIDGGTPIYRDANVLVQIYYKVYRDTRNED